MANNLPKCKNCKHYREDDPSENKLGKCENPSFQWTVEETMRKGEAPTPNIDGMIAVDSEYYCAWIEVGENFGCIHHSDLNS